MSVIAGVVTGFTVSHQSGGVDAIEAAAVEDPTAAMEQLREREPVTECFALQTCNRSEWFVVTPADGTGRDVLREEFPTLPVEAGKWLGHEAALEHLLRVGAGLESMVLGEDQILGQLRRAGEDAERVGALGYLLEDAVWKAVHCGERVRTETGINEGVVSLARAAVQLGEELVEITESRALVVGAGEMGRRSAQALADATVARLHVANRTLPHAEHVAESVEVTADASTLDELGDAVAAADIVITATGSPDPLLDPATFNAAGPTTVIDIGQPRDVDPAVRNLRSVDVYDLDDLEEITTRTRADRERAVAAAESIVDEELAHLHARFKRKQADDVIAAMYEGAEGIKQRELRTARNRLMAGGDLSAEQFAVLEDLADALVGQLLAAPTKSLREAAEEDDWATIQAALQLFDPEFADGRVEMPEGAPFQALEEAGEDA